MKIIDYVISHSSVIGNYQSMYQRESVREGYGKTEDTIRHCQLNTG